MACPTVQSGQDFLAGALAHVDCQAQSIGAYGWGALESTGSPVSLAMTSLLTIFIALFGIRVMLGYPMAGRDIVADILKVGIVLTLATSWPAWRILGYDLVIDGSAQIAQVIGIGAGLPGSEGDLAARLQNLDRGFAAFNVYGSGRLGVAQGDWFQLGFARIAFLTGTLGPMALVRLLTGVLLALCPLMAGLLLFGGTRGIFEGWVRALVAVFLASIALSAVYGVELALLEPWMAGALQQRAAQQQVLDAPVEILVAALSFALASLAAVFFVGRLAFHNSLRLTVFTSSSIGQGSGALSPSQPTQARSGDKAPSRAITAAHSVAENLRREERMADIDRIQGRWSQQGAGEPTPAALAAQSGPPSRGEALGTSWRKATPRTSGAARRRDRT